MRSFHVENTTDDVLCNGTVAILEAGRFAGQVEFAPMLPGDDQVSLDDRVFLSVC